MVDPVRLYALADGALQAVRSVMEVAYPDPRYLHGRHGVVNGPPALDGWVEVGGCSEHLVAWVEATVPTNNFPAPEARRILCATTNAAVQVVVQSIRCEPTVHSDEAGSEVYWPTSEELDDAARMVLADAWVMWNALECWVVSLKDPAAGGLAAGADAAMIGGSPVAPQGGVAGWEVRVLVEGGDVCCPLPAADGWQWPEDFLPDP